MIEKAKADRLASENRSLRREQRGGKRDEVILQLETELGCKEQERAEMEENLAAAFGAALDEAQNRIAQLTQEREDLMVRLEEATHGRKGRK